MTDPTHCDVHVDLPPAAAFTRFVDDLSLWWPLSYTWSGAKFSYARIEPAVGGFWGETDAEDFDWAWGEVRAYAPGQRLVLSFNMGADRQAEPPERRSEVEISFQPDGAGTHIRLEHRDLDKHGVDAAAIARDMGERGWPLILATFERETRRARPTAS
jgi:uncharacterized protein YndB with AHSA1/START domain